MRRQKDYAVAVQGDDGEFHMMGGSYVSEDTALDVARTLEKQGKKVAVYHGMYMIYADGHRTDAAGNPSGETMNQSQRIREQLRTINEPSNVVASFAQKSGKSEKEVEDLWDKAKAQAKKEYPEAGEDRHYAITTGILKKMLKID